MKKAFLKIFVTLFCVITAAPWIAWGSVKLFAPEKFSGYSEDLSENRNLAVIDKEALWSSGDSVSAYIDDHAPFRSALIVFYQKIDSKAELAYSKTVSYVSGIFSKNESTKTQVTDLSSFYGDSSSVSVPVISVPTEPVKEHVHEYSVSDEKLPDCENDGYRLYTCNGCGDYYTETLEKSGHDGVLSLESTASYTTYGFKEYVCRTCKKTYRTDIEPKLADTSYLAPRSVGEGILFGKHDWLFYTGNNSVAYYKGTNLLDDETLAEYAAKTNRLNELCKERGIKLYLLFCPNKEQVYSEYMPSYEVETDYKRTQRLVDYINENTDVPAVYPIEELKAADFYWQTYYKYDTHWNRTGAFIGLMALYKAMGKETVNPIELNGEYVPAMLDLCFALGGLDPSNYAQDREFLFEYKPELTVDGVDIAKNVCRLTSGSDNDERFVMLGDSFRSLMLEYIGRDYANATVIHRDYMSSVKKDIQNCDILVMEAVERYDARTFKAMDTVIEYLESVEE